VAETTVSTDLLQSFKILTQLVFQLIGSDLAVFAILDVFLSVQEPIGDFVLARVGHDCDHLLNLFVSEFTGTFGNLNIGLLQDDIGVSSADTFNRGDGEHNLNPSINIGIEDTQNVLERVSSA